MDEQVMKQIIEEILREAGLDVATFPAESF